MHPHTQAKSAFTAEISDLLKTIYIQTQTNEPLTPDHLVAALPDMDALDSVLHEATTSKLVRVKSDSIKLTELGQQTALGLLLPQSESVENFVKAVYALQQHSERVSTNALRDVLNITAPSVTDMAKRLQEAGLIDHRKYYGVRLTPLGERVALRTIRRHRLIELFLVQELGYALHEVHIEAEALEHAVSDRFVEAIDTRLDHPHFDPHGDPIPAADGTIKQRDLRPLSELELDTTARVSRYLAEESDMLQHILERGFQLNTPVAVRSRDPFNGPLTIVVGDTNAETVLGYNIADLILVEVVE